jgi:hypothetical protein
MASEPRPKTKRMQELDRKLRKARGEGKRLTDLELAELGGYVPGRVADGVSVADHLRYYSD